MNLSSDVILLPYDWVPSGPNVIRPRLTQGFFRVFPLAVIVQLPTRCKLGVLEVLYKQIGNIIPVFNRELLLPVNKINNGVYSYC